MCSWWITINDDNIDDGFDEYASYLCKEEDGMDDGPLNSVDVIVVVIVIVMVFQLQQ